jgi:alkanesulfonate monooxygenase SsuD/methylene tetrahydromethanopterin reductase-like flavin-dependent oxidoreductase (luciferase family)
MASLTERIALAVDVINTSLRHPFLLAGQLAVAQAASGGRLEVGLGAGSYHLARFDHMALGRPFPPLGKRRLHLAGCCIALPMLWRGEEVTDPCLKLNRAALGPLGIDAPPIFVGGAGERTMRIAAEHADGWNAVVDSVERYRELSERLDAICDAVGRERPLRKAAQVFLRDVRLARSRAFIDGLEAVGADAVTFVLVGERGPGAVEDLARALLP